MYQCIIPPRVFLAIGVGFLIFGLVLGWISFSVPDWLQYYERNGVTNATKRDNSNDTNIQDDMLISLKKFGLWYKCVYSKTSNDFSCVTWNKDAPSKRFKMSISNLSPFFVLNRFCGCCAGSHTLWFMSQMFFIFYRFNWPFISKNFCYYFTYSCIISFSKL